MSATRAACAASWGAAMRQAPRPVILNHSSAAGLLLSQSGGDAGIALEAARELAFEHRWWDRVVWTLEKILDEEARRVVGAAAE